MSKAGGEYKEVLFEIRNKVAWISINRPGSKKCIPGADSR